MHHFNQSGSVKDIPLLVAIAVIGVIGFILATKTFPFGQNDRFNTMYTKPSALASSNYLTGSNLGVWGMNSDGTVNENFVNPFAKSTDPNDPTKEYTQAQLSTGVIGLLRFPAREAGKITDQGLKQVQDAIVAARVAPLVVLPADNTEQDRVTHLVKDIFTTTSLFEYGNEDNYFGHPNDTQNTSGWSGTTYGQHWIAGVAKIRAARSNIQIGGPVVSHIAEPGDLTKSDNRYLSDFLDTIRGQTNLYPDFISFHLYNEHGEATDLTTAQILSDVSDPANPNDWGDKIDWVRSFTKQKLCFDTVTNATPLCQNGVPVALTEWNWDASPENNAGRVDSRDLDTNFMNQYTSKVLTTLQSKNVYIAAQYGYGSDMGGNHLTMLSPWTAPEIKPQYYAFKNFVTNSTPPPSVSPTPSRTPTPQPTPTQTPIPSGSTLSIYDDSLSPLFLDYSYGGTINFSSTLSPYSGSNAIQMQITGPNFGVNFHAINPINISALSNLSFAGKVASTGTSYEVLINDGTTQKSVPLANFGGDFTTSWKVYTIPLTQFNGLNFSSISSVVIKELSDSTGKTVYLDNVKFTGNSTPTPSPSTSPCQGADLDHNGTVNIFDYNIMVGNFGKSGVGVSGGDIDNNGTVNIFDYNIIVGNFAKTGC
jgi:hypothetical protein